MSVTSAPRGSARHARRLGALLVASVLACSVSASAAGAAKLKINDACTFVTEQQIGDKFGEPVEVVPIHFVGTFDCVWDVAGGPEAPGGGRFQVLQLYPNFAVGLESARSAFVDERVIGNLSMAKLEELDDVVGKEAFLNYSKNQLAVLANKKLAFTLIWEDDDRASELLPKDVKKLVAMAKGIIRRAAK